MGNRAVVTTRNKDVGVYLHWNGGRDSVEAFLTYCSLRHFRPPEEDGYGWARLCQVVGNFFGGGLSIGIDSLEKLDCDNKDNGVYIIENWKIVGREFFDDSEQNTHDRLEMLKAVNRQQPVKDRLSEKEIKDGLKPALVGEAP